MKVEHIIIITQLLIKISVFFLFCMHDMVRLYFLTLSSLIQFRCRPKTVLLGTRICKATLTKFLCVPMIHSNRMLQKLSVAIRFCLLSFFCLLMTCYVFSVSRLCTAWLHGPKVINTETTCRTLIFFYNTSVCVMRFVMWPRQSFSCFSCLGCVVVHVVVQR